MEKSEKISGLIITFNEEKNIAEVLKCFDFCDEIIIVDSFSTDKTVEIASQNPKVKVYQNQFVDFTRQRNFALEKASNDWILFLDGDERITPDLKNEILAELKKTKLKNAYYFFRKFYFAGKPLHFSGTQTDKNFRFFRKSKCQYISEKKVHETLEVEGEIGKFKNKLHHFSVEDYCSYHRKMTHYGTLKGQELFLKGKKFSCSKQLFKTMYKFLFTYIFRLGILDGKEGFQLSLLQSLSVYETYYSLKKEELNNK